MKETRCPTCNIDINKRLHHRHRPWYKEPLYIVSIFTAVILALNLYMPVLNPLVDSILFYANTIWWAILIGLLIGGFIAYFVPEEYVSKHLGYGSRAIPYAVVLGFLMSACSHGILAIAVALYKRGASTSAVIAFLLASPWANLPMTVIMFAFFGLNAFIMILGSLLIAVVSGFVFRLLESRNKVEKGNVIETKKGFSVRADIKKRVRNYRFKGSDITNIMKSSWDLAKAVLWWVIIGVILASFVGGYVPHEIMQTYFGPTLLGLFATLLIASIIEVCSEGSSPLAFEIYRQTGAFGNSFTFLNAGVATDFTEIGIISSNIGKRTAIWTVLITVPQILVLGYLFNIFV